MGEFYKILPVQKEVLLLQNDYCNITTSSTHFGQHFINVFLFVPILSNVNLCVYVCSLFITLILLHCIQSIVWRYQWGYSRTVHRSTDNIIAKRGYSRAVHWSTDNIIANRGYSRAVHRSTDNIITKRGYSRTVHWRTDNIIAKRGYSRAVHRSTDNIIANRGNHERFIEVQTI
jgi:hypothetical protein